MSLIDNKHMILGAALAALALLILVKKKVLHGLAGSNPEIGKAVKTS